MVDINPHKHGKYLAGSGHQIVGPDALVEIKPDVVVVMNPIYVEEIRADLAPPRSGARDHGTGVTCSSRRMLAGGSRQSAAARPPVTVIDADCAPITLRVDALATFRGLVPARRVEDQLARRRTEPQGQGRIVAEADDGVGEARDVAVRHDQAGDLVLQQLGRARERRRWPCRPPCSSAASAAGPGIRPAASGRPRLPTGGPAAPRNCRWMISIACATPNCCGHRLERLEARGDQQAQAQMRPHRQRAREGREHQVDALIGCQRARYRPAVLAHRPIMLTAANESISTPFGTTVIRCGSKP